MRLSEAQEVQSLFSPDAPEGAFRVIGKLGGPHPADGASAMVAMGDGAFMSIINPQSFADGGIEWKLRYGSAAGVALSAASLIASYDYLLSSAISMKEATRRLRLLRAARAVMAGRAALEQDRCK